MTPSEYGTPLGLGVAGSLAVGLLLITFPNPVFTTVGVLLVILGLVGLMPVVRIALVADGL